MDYVKELSKNILFYRKQMGLTQEELAEKLGITFQAVSKWENAVSSPDISILPVLGDIFGISVDKLLGRSCVSDLDLPWDEDAKLRTVVFQGRKIMTKYDELSKFTFKLEGAALDVICYCNIECGNIQNNATAAGDINCDGNITGSVTCEGDLNAAREISGNVTCVGDINIDGEINGDVTCMGDLNIDGEINGDIRCSGDLIYSK